MSPWAALAIFAAGFAAGTINVIVGSGSLVTFPTLLALGYPPLLANVSNNVGLVPGSVSGVLAYRPELVGQRSRLIRLGTASLLGGLAGAGLLLGLPGTVFRAAVPALILVACILMALQPRLSRRLQERGDPKAHGGTGLFVGVFLTGVYGGYFGAAQGVILIALLAIFVADDLQRLNGTKNVLAMVVNTVASVLFIIFSTLSWSVVGLIAAGSVIGGQVGARIGRRLPAAVLRGVIVTVGLVVACILFAEWY
ncbi:MAG TPA: sulfite exporter TauE/SafE family protein [Acidimicrobiales bacterium]|jgi:hypothetical protein|nr:sulfite exporter TauE/SafE family protein [Acidimicrobiales bacterium]